MNGACSGEKEGATSRKAESWKHSLHQRDDGRVARCQLAHTFLHTRFGVNVVHGTIDVGHDESLERVIFGTGEFKHYAAGVDDQRVNHLDRTRFSRPRALPELLPVGPSLEGFGNRGGLLVPGPLCLGLPNGRRRTSCTPLVKMLLSLSLSLLDDCDTRK